MTELQLLIRDSNGMPPVIRADYLEDAGYDLEADWVRRGEFRRNPRLEAGFADGRGLFRMTNPNSNDFWFCICCGVAGGTSYGTIDGAAWNLLGWGHKDAGFAPGVDGLDRRLPTISEGN